MEKEKGQDEPVKFSANKLDGPHTRSASWEAEVKRLNEQPP